MGTRLWVGSDWLLGTPPCGKGGQSCKITRGGGFGGALDGGLALDRELQGMQVLRHSYRAGRGETTGRDSGCGYGQMELILDLCYLPLAWRAATRIFWHNFSRRRSGHRLINTSFPYGMARFPPTSGLVLGTRCPRGLFRGIFKRTFFIIMIILFYS